MANGPRDPATYAEVADISASDHQFSGRTRGISFGVAGTLHVTLIGGSEITFVEDALVAGVIHPIRVSIVHDDSTADAIVGYW